MRAPTHVESGAVVPISTAADFTDVRAISVLIDKNSPPLAAHFSLSGALAFVAINVKMASTSDVHIVVSAGGKLYTAKQSVEVAVGA